MPTILVDQRPERDAETPSIRTPAVLRAAPALILALGVFAGAGCGLKGDLYLPDNQTPATPPATVDDDSATGDEDAG